MINLFKVRMSPDAARRVANVLASGYTGQGPMVDEFEEGLKGLLKSPVDLLTVNSGTSALTLALHLAGVGHGDEVVTTPMTCSATNSAILSLGAIPVWADVDARTGLISPTSVAEAMGPRVKAIMAVDWGGAPCDYDALRDFGVPVVQDAAHAWLGKTGGDYVCWSLQAIKHLTTGDGGLLMTPADQVDRARLLRWFGLDRRSSKSFRCSQLIEESGFKYQMNDIAAAIGLANLPLSVDSVAQHQKNALFYHEALGDLERVGSRITLPEMGVSSSWWLYTLLVEDRDGFRQFAAKYGVETSPVHSRNDKHPCFQRVARQPGPLQGLDFFSKHEVAIPVGWWLTDKERDRVTDMVHLWARS